MNDSNPQTQGDVGLQIQPPIVPKALDTTPDPAVRFRGLGTNFKAKMIGIDDVPESRGDKMCQESILKLKAAVLASGQHKQKIIVNVSLEGIKIVDILTGEVQHVHPVHRISFIARDLTDRRAFGYVYGAGEGRHQFFGIKTAKVAEVLVLALRDLFQVVYDMKKKEMDQARAVEVVPEKKTTEDAYSQPPKPDNPVKNTPPTEQQSNGSLLDLEKQLTNIQEGINNIDSFSPWPQDLPTSPDTPGFSPGGDESGSDMFGIANLSDISSLSSDFSCASTNIVDSGHGGGGDGRNTQIAQQFERSGSARSAASWQGFKSGHRQHHSVRASSHSARSHRLGSLSDPSTIVTEEPATSETVGNSILQDDLTHARKKVNLSTQQAIKQGESDTKESNEKVAEETKVKENRSRPATVEKTRDTLRSSTSTLSLPGSDKKGAKSSSSSFFSRNKKSAKKNEHKKSKKEKEKHKGSKSADERMPSPVQKNLNTKQSTNDLPEDNRKVLKKTTSSYEFSRRESISSVNSVRSCVFPSTTHSNKKTPMTSSQTSLDKGLQGRKVRSSSKASQPSRNTENVTSSLPSYIVQSSICPRTRPKVKHSGRVAEAEHNPRNPPMFKRHSNTPEHENEASVPNSDYSTDLPAEIGAEEVGNGNSEPPEKPSLAWTASFEADFDNLQQNHKESEDSNVDPFTGLKAQDMKIPSSDSAVFDDAAWDVNCSVSEVKRSQASLDPAENPPFAVAPFEDDPFTEVDPFSGASPFHGIDPFSDLQVDDALTDPFSAFEDKDIFCNSESGEIISEETSSTGLPREVVASDSDSDFNHPSVQSNEPTFPKGSENFTINLKDIKNNSAPKSADSSSLTSGMSTPIVASSPVHCAKTSPPPTTSCNISQPPPLPPRLPPRPQKIPSVRPPLSTAIYDECPDVPPPPLPDNFPTYPLEDVDEDFFFEDVEDESDVSPPDYLPPLFPESSLITSEDTKRAPTIPERSGSSVSADSPDHSSLRGQNDKQPFGNYQNSDDPVQQSTASNGMPQKTSSYSDDLFALSAPAIEPAPEFGAKLTKNQILMGYGTAGGTMGQQPGMFGHPGMMAPPAQYAVGHQSQQTQGYPQVMAQPAAYGMFPSGPSPAIPPRPGAMRPPAPHILSGGAPQNPFGDAAGQDPGGMLSPMSQVTTSSSQPEETKTRADPFSNLLSGMGGSGTVNKKEMFKNYQMVKPPQPPPRTNPPPNTSNGTGLAPEANASETKPVSDFENYFLNTVGGVPIEDTANNNTKVPVAAPRSSAAQSDPFGLGDISSNPDPFASDQGFSQPFEFNQNANNNSQSLFG